MRERFRRHLGLLFDAPSTSVDAAKILKEVYAPSFKIPVEFSPRQFAVILLHIAAAVEHSLMVEYLYAGFSLCGPEVPAPRRTEVAQWQETILGIAKEEMGHLMTVQNLLRCIGGPLSLERDDYPWDSELYPFPFCLEPLTRQVLAKFVYAESPDPRLFTGPEAEEIRRLAEQDTGGHAVHRVEVLYELLKQIFTDPKLLADSDFRQDTFPFQANWDEWGRGYKAGDRGNTVGRAMPATPDLLLLPVTARTDAVDAINKVATQGEAPLTADDAIPSHFARFLRIFREFPKDESWSPTKKVPVNPVALTTIGGPDANESSSDVTPISHPETKLWAHLFNLRYRSLLVNLLRTFEYPSNLSETSSVTPRGLLIHATFGEMYNLRSLAQILMQLPLAEKKGSDLVAGPPFQMPYTLRLPVDPVDRWHVHVDLLEASRCLAEQLLERASAKHALYLRTLLTADCQAKDMIDTILKGAPKHC
jgi:Ferritin-like